MWADFDAFCREHGETGLSYGDLGPEFMAESPWLNLYSYPAEADYEREIAARPDLAPPRLDGPRGRHDLGRCRPSSPSGRER